MDTLPQQPASQHDAALERRQRYLEEQDIASLSAAPSWGERLLPYLFAVMETCWIDAILIGIAGLDRSSSQELFMPFWVPFVLIAVAYWLTTYLERRTTATSAEHSSAKPSAGAVVAVLLLVGSVLFAVWSSVYASSIAFFDPSWLGALLNDLLLLNPNAWHIVGIFALSLYFCWRGLRLSRSVLEPGNVLFVLRLGLSIIIAMLGIRVLSGAGFFDELFLLLLIPLFLACTLAAHALAQATFIRRSHATGLQGSVVAQERSLFVVVGIIGIVLLCVSLLVGTFTSPAFLAQVQRTLEPVALAYDWITRIIAYAVVILFTPIFWLLQLLHLRTTAIRLRVFPIVSTSKKRPLPLTSSDAFSAILILLIKIVLPIVFLVLIVLLVRLALRRRRIRLTGREEDEHESLWSWDLFWAQLRVFLRAFWFRIFPERAVQERQAIEEEVSSAPTARSIREIYRALLRWAASRGYVRKKDETPYEFRSRLDESFPLAEPELGTVTEAYTAIRYGQVVPSEAEVAHVQQVWAQLQQKTKETSQR